ncbi:MAG: hypothetical protein ABI641_00955 [Caldimonas sp.]
MPARLLPRPSFASLLVVAGLTAASSALAAGKTRQTLPDKSANAMLTQAQLKECLARRDRLHAQTDDALKDKTATEAGKAEIDRSGAALAEQLPALDRASSDAVGDYNARVAARDRMIDDYQAKVAAYNVKAEAVLSAKASYEAVCENQRYDERDLVDLKKKKR